MNCVLRYIIQQILSILAYESKEADREVLEKDAYTKVCTDVGGEMVRDDTEKGLIW